MPCALLFNVQHQSGKRNGIKTSWTAEHCYPMKGSSVCRRLSLLSEKASSLAVSQVTPTATGWCKISHAEVRVTPITLSLRTTSVLVAPCSDFKVLLLSLLCRALTSSWAFTESTKLDTSTGRKLQLLCIGCFSGRYHLHEPDMQEA